LWATGTEETEDEAFFKMQAEIDAIMMTPSPTNSATEGTPVIHAENAVTNFGDSKILKRTIAAVSALLASAVFFVQHNAADVASGVALLRKMEADSVPLPKALCSGKPTLIEFFAPWCESCKETAPGMRALELQYRDKLNFVAIDGANVANAKLVTLFRVDGIPHMAFIDQDTAVRTTLVGAVPKEIVREDINALLERKTGPLPYEGFDAFGTSDEGRVLVKDKSLCVAK